jgi:hypothetical protein
MIRKVEDLHNFNTCIQQHSSSLRLFIGCCDNDHDHNNAEELAKLHLIHLVEPFPGLFPYLAMPVDTKLVFETSQVIVFRPDEQGGQVDSGNLLSSLP